MNHDSKRSITIMKNIIVIVSLLLCLAGSASAQEHFLEIIKAEQNQKSIARGETIPGMMVNEDKDVKVGRKLNVGDRVFVPKDVRVTFESSNRNTIEPETISNAEFIVSNITNKGEAYYQLFGKIRYVVIPKAVEFFNVYHAKYLAAVEGTVFVINVDLKNKEIECTAEQGTFTVTREYKVKAGDKDIEGLKEIVIVSDREGKQRTVKYKLGVDEAFQVFKNYEDVLAYFKEHLKKDEQEGNKLKIIAAKNNIGRTFLRLAKYDEAIKIFAPILKEATVLQNEEWIATASGNLGVAWDSKGEYEKAIEFYQKALSIDEKVFGSQHPKVAIRYNNLGAAWDSKGEYDKAIEFFQKALKIFIKYLGENHPNTKTVKRNIEAVKKKMNRD